MIILKLWFLAISYFILVSYIISSASKHFAPIRGSFGFMHTETVNGTRTAYGPLERKNIFLKKKITGDYK